MENTRGKSKKHKSYTKQKSKSATDEVDEKESPVLNSVDRIRTSGHLATTPVSPAGNIVDMQGSLDHGSVDKSEDEKINNNKDSTDSNNKNECDKKVIDGQELDKKQEDEKSVSGEVGSETETAEANSVSENTDAEGKTVFPVETKNLEKEDTTDQKNTTDEASESSIKQSVSESQGEICRFLSSF